MANRLPAGVTELQRIRREGFVVGRYQFAENPGSKLGSPQLILLQHEGEPFTLSWRPLDFQAPIYQHVLPGQFYISPPEQLIDIAWKGNHPAFGIALSPSFVAKAVASTFPTGGSGLRAQIGQGDVTLTNATTLLRSSLTHRLNNNSMSLVCAFLAIRIYEIFGDKVSSPPIITSGLGIARLQRILAFIDMHLSDDLTLDLLAAEARLSPDHFGKAFRASMSMTPFNYIAQRRITTAKELLLNPSISITEIAMRLGFSSHSHFTDLFRKTVGLTPSQWRRDRI